MVDTQQACETIAVRKVRAIFGKRRFPTGVFVSGWGEFNFFDSDRLFSEGLINTVKGLLTEEGSSCACIVDLDANPHGPRRGYFAINRQTNPDEYRKFRVGNSTTPWVTKLSRFGCASEQGNWALYGEGQVEIGVIGKRDSWSQGNLHAAVSELIALPIRRSIEIQHIYGLSSRSLSDDWKVALLRAYE